MIDMLSAITQSNVEQLEGQVMPFDATLDAEAAEAFNRLCGRRKQAMYLVKRISLPLPLSRSS